MDMTGLAVQERLLVVSRGELVQTVYGENGKPTFMD